MFSRVLIVLAMLLIPLGSQADTYTVSKDIDTLDPGTLRWAITEANTRPGSDLIDFDPGMMGGIIRPATPLPPITDSGLTIDADINDDGAPDVDLRGGLLTGGHGIQIAANRTEIIGLAIVGMPWCGIWAWNCADCVIRACYIGITGDEMDHAPNRLGGICFYNTEDCEIGQPTGQGRNVIWCGDRTMRTACIDLLLSRRTLVRNNHLGVTPDGSRRIGMGRYGILIWDGRFARARGRRLMIGELELDAGGDVPEALPGDANVVGGNSEMKRNIVAGMAFGVVCYGASNSAIMGNWFGLMPDGLTSGNIGQYSILIGEASTGTIIGGRNEGQGNVFGRTPAGVGIGGAEVENTTIQGNWFGQTALGTRERRMRFGVLMLGGGANTEIGGGAEGAANYFTPNAPTGETFGVSVLVPDEGTVIRGNVFGKRPGDNRNATMATFGVGVAGGEIRVADNRMGRAWACVGAGGTGTHVEVHGNVFRYCSRGVLLDLDCTGNLGDLGNASDYDNGGNEFQATCDWAIRNQTAHDVPAEGNDFGTTDETLIHDRIWDIQDAVGLGTVDIDPLIGGVSPTGSADGALTVTSAAAAPAGLGSELTFHLSAAASVNVQVLNIAGRPVASVVTDKQLQAGTQRLTWTGQTATGVAAPSGRYVVRILARSDDGSEANAACPLLLER